MMTTMACFTLLTLFAMVMATREIHAADGEGAAGALTRQLQSAWADIQSKLDEILDRRDKDSNLPESSLLPSVISETKQSNRRKIDKLLENLGQTMLSSPAYDHLRAIRDLEERIALLRDRERRFRNEAFSAPAAKPAYRLDVSTADELRGKAEECAREIAQAEQDILNHRQMIAQDLRSWGVDLNPAQQELLFSSVIGDDMLQNSIILKNVKSVLEQMARHIGQDNRDPQAPKRYYGSYLSFVDILIDSNQTTLDNIRETWLPRLANMMNKARETTADAKRAIASRNYKEQQVKAFEANIEANRLTIKVGELYREFLNRQALAIEKRLEELATDRATSQNTYDTVTVSSNLSELIQRGLQDLDALGHITLPEMHLFENLEQQREFAELSNRMTQTPALVTK